MHTQILDETMMRKRKRDYRKGVKTLGSIFLKAPNPIFVIDENGEFLDTNIAALGFFECSREWLIGKRIKDLSPEALSKGQENISHPISGLKSFEMDYLIRGKIKTLILSPIPLTISDRGSILLIGQDITGIKGCEADVHAGADEYRLLVENQADLLIKINREGNLLFVNPAFCRLSNKNEDLLLGSDFLSFVFEQDRKTAQEKIEGIYFQPRTCYLECRIQARDGWRWFEWSLSAISEKGDALDCIIGTGRDISERKKADSIKEEMQKQILQIKKMEALGSFAGGIAHDFNKLLLIINGYADFLSQRLNQNNVLKKDIGEIKKAADHASLLTDQLLAFSRSKVLQPRLLDLNAVIADVERLLKRIVGDNIQLIKKLDHSLRRIKSDPAQTYQVIMNLVVNARDSMPHGGEIYIETENITLEKKDTCTIPEARPGKHVCLSISDSGTGMEQKVTQHIFEPFATVPAGSNKSSLSLSAVYGIVKQHGGFIRVKSEPGKGSEFKIFFPAFSIEDDLERDNR